MEAKPTEAAVSDASVAVSEKDLPKVAASEAKIQTDANETEEGEAGADGKSLVPSSAGADEAEEDGGTTGEEGEGGKGKKPGKKKGKLSLMKEKRTKRTVDLLLKAELGGKQEKDGQEEEEEGSEGISLLLRNDSSLTKAQIIEKDGIMYDMLMANEDIWVGGFGPKPKEDEEEEDEEEEEEEEETEEEEEQEEEEEDEVEELPEEQEAETEPPVDPNDPDNIINMMMEQAEDEDEGFLLMVDQAAPEEQVDTVANYPGVLGITLSDETIHFLELDDLSNQDPPYSFVSFKRIMLHIYIYGENSEFFQHLDKFKNYPDFSMLIGLDLVKSTGHLHYLCTTLEARNMVLIPPKKKRVFIDHKKKQEEAWAKLASIKPRKWRGFASEIEVDEETVKDSRPLLTMYAYRDRDKFNKVGIYQDRTVDTHPDMYASFEPEDKALHPKIECKEIDVAVQVMPEKYTSMTQTGFSFKRNKIIQFEDQFMDPDKVKELMDSVSPDILYAKSKPLQRAIMQNEMMNLTLDDYKLLQAVKGHEVEYSNESILLQEYQTFSDLRHSKGRCVTMMIFHPTLEDIIVMSTAVDATFDKRIDFHSEMLAEPNFVLFWDLKDPIHPQFMLDAPNDVFSFMINPSDPHLVCGGCANGQVALWDLGKLHSELRSRVQDRRKTNTHSDKKEPSFLDKLKDKAEKYVCPLVPTAGLSNLDQSHKRVVTSVVWLPPHVELGKNGNMYDNPSGKSVQFFSTAGDGTLRLWDIRPPRSGLEEYDVDPNREIIKVNPWIHLENNMWKVAMKYQMEMNIDGTTTAMPVTTLSLSEQKLADIAAMENLALLASASTTSANAEKKQSLSKSKEGMTGSKEGIDESKEGPEKSKEAITTSKEEVAKAKERSMSVRPSIIGLVTLDGDGTDGNSDSKPGAMMRINPNALTSIFVGSETGQTALVDWLRNKDGTVNVDLGPKMCQNIYCEVVHDGAITSISRSPFYNNIILVVGGGTISIWKETTGHPLLATSGSEYFPWCGCWSYTRPAVFFIGTREGAIQVWDLTEKSHAPVLIQQITGARITNCAVPKATLTKKQFLALSDSAGTLFVMLLPRYYYKPTNNENEIMRELIEREEKRLAEWETDHENRVEKMEAFHTAWKEGRLLKTAEQLLEIELQEENRLNGEYLEFLEFEAKLVGKLKRDEPVILDDENVEEDYANYEDFIEAIREKQKEWHDARAREEEESTEEETSASDAFDQHKGDEPTSAEKVEPDDDFNYDDFVIDDAAWDKDDDVQDLLKPKEKPKKIPGAESKATIAGAASKAQIAGAESKAQIAPAESKAKISSAESTAKIAPAESKAKISSAESKAKIAPAESKAKITTAESKAKLTPESKDEQKDESKPPESKADIPSGEK